MITVGKGKGFNVWLQDIESIEKYSGYAIVNLRCKVKGEYSHTTRGKLLLDLIKVKELNLKKEDFIGNNPLNALKYFDVSIGEYLKSKKYRALKHQVVTYNSKDNYLELKDTHFELQNFIETNKLTDYVLEELKEKDVYTKEAILKFK